MNIFIDNTMYIQENDQSNVIGEFKYCRILSTGTQYQIMGMGKTLHIYRMVIQIGFPCLIQ